MISPEYYLLPLVMKEVTGILDYFKTGYMFLDVFLLAMFGILCYNNSLDVHTINGMVVRKISAWLNRKTKYAISMSGTETARSGRSFRFRAVMHHLHSNKKNNTLRSLQEVTDYGRWSDEDRAKDQISEYLVNQAEVFTLDSGKDIQGRITKYFRERQTNQSCKERVDMTTLEIYSYSTDVFGLQEWLETVTQDYKQYLRLQCSEHQLLLTTMQGHSKNRDRRDDSAGGSTSSITIEAIPWDSTITFENSYFPDMENVLQKINFFLDNKQWYKDHGIPYNLGILLYGDPGCGKTRFIKQLLNHTKRHGICVNLGEISEFNDLNKIIYNEELDDEYVIPQEKRILILEDIDAMGEAVKSRKKPKPASSSSASDASHSSASGAIDMLCMLKDLNEQKQQQSKLNLAIILNALDGVHECTGRIVVMTTNHPELLDEALVRSGRIDIKVEFKRCTRYDITQLIKRFWKVDIAVHDMPSGLDGKYTAADVINIFNGTRDFETIRQQFLN